MNRVFISYSKSRAQREALFYALRDHGLNPWRDVESLNSGDDTTDVIQAELATCTMAVLWINRDFFTSDYVAIVEIPAISKAHQNGVRVVPIFEDVTPEAAADLANKRFGIEISDLHGYSVEPGSPVEVAHQVAGRLVKVHVQDAKRRGAAPTVRLVSYDDTADSRDDAVLNLDWRHRLVNGHLEPEDEHLLRSALTNATKAIKETYGAYEIELFVKAHFPLAAALGHAFSEPTGCTLRMAKTGNSWISTRTPSDATLLQKSKEQRGPADSRVACLGVSITRDVKPGINAYSQQGQRYRSRLILTPPSGPGRDSVDGPETANEWARQVADVLADLGTQPDIDRIDLFLAVPVELAVLIGWWANATGRIDLMNWTDKTGPYRRMWTLP